MGGSGKRGGGREVTGEKWSGCRLGCGRRPEAAKNSVQLVMTTFSSNDILLRKIFVQPVMGSFLPNYILNSEQLSFPGSSFEHKRRPKVPLSIRCRFISQMQIFSLNELRTANSRAGSSIMRKNNERPYIPINR